MFECKVCPPGHYCNATYGPVVYYGSYICPEGHYCPNGTEYSDQYPCPRGTFNNRTGERPQVKKGGSPLGHYSDQWAVSVQIDSGIFLNVLGAVSISTMDRPPE